MLRRNLEGTYGLGEPVDISQAILVEPVANLYRGVRTWVGKLGIVLSNSKSRKSIKDQFTECKVDQEIALALILVEPSI